MPGSSAKRSNRVPSPEQLRDAVEKVTAFIKAGRLQPEHVLGLTLIAPSTSTEAR